MHSLHVFSVLCIFSGATDLAWKHSARATTAADLDRQISELRTAGKIAQAVPLAQQALALAVDRDGRDSGAVANALITLADLYIDQGRKAEAEPLLRRALEIIKEAGAGSDQIAATEQKLAALKGQGAVQVQNTRKRSRRGFAQQRSNNLSHSPKMRSRVPPPMKPLGMWCRSSTERTVPNYLWSGEPDIAPSAGDVLISDGRW